MKSVNKCLLLGFLGVDPEIRFLPSGAIVASLSLATNEGYKDSQGNWQERTEWHRLAAYGKLAETARDHLKKGHRIYVEGKIQTRSWEKDGVKQYRTEVVVSQFVPLYEPAAPSPGPPVPGPLVSRSQETRKTLAEELTPELGETGITDSDIPF